MTEKARKTVSELTEENPPNLDTGPPPHMAQEQALGTLFAADILQWLKQDKTAQERLRDYIDANTKQETKDAFGVAGGLPLDYVETRVTYAYDVLSMMSHVFEHMGLTQAAIIHHFPGMIERLMNGEAPDDFSV
jgi:hypothetical protein